MKFKINNSNWEIKEISADDMWLKTNDYTHEYFTHGLTRYVENIIYINESTSEKKRTLKHELMHCWLYMYGHNQEKGNFSNEDICEIVAASNDFVNEIVKQYFKE